MDTATISHWLIAGLFALFWGLCAGNNWFYVIQACRRMGSTSLTLILGGIAGALALFVAPVDGLWQWFWVPMLLDPGCLPALVMILHQRIFGAKDTA